MAGTQGIIIPASVSNEIVYPIDAFVRAVFFQEAPLIAGLPRKPIGADQFNFGTAKARSKVGALGAALADGVGTTLTAVDVSVYQIGDVIELVSGERVEVVADPVILTPSTGAGTVLVRRAVEGTTGAAQANSSATYLLYNSRTGGEIDQTGTRQGPTFLTQYVQTFQYPVQVGGKANAMNAIALAAGVGGLFQSEKDRRLVEMVKDMETAVLYGKGDNGATGNRKKMKGVKQIITEGTPGNVTVSPTNASAYGPTDLHRDTIQKVVDAGGRPDTIMVSSGMMSAFVKWGWAKVMQAPSDPGTGTNIQQMYVPLLGYPVALVVDLGLRGNTAAALSSTDGMGESRIRLRSIRQEQWNVRGNRGDAVEGEWLADTSVEVDDPSHHAWVEGITAFTTP